ncbi:hypothetical protein PtA15_5A500 [Puccinia triticina]|uniref:ABC-2 type transporter domain-containing protein n=1 Tax=Puccinia triticina TaxID=208348 RepID=A0ABY7CQ91_9BASI|nr:uncharacterized protein PtA15_5A500 [Puccinia triticina]WAQ84927.1 hypothetical protein PtA15_5A500 [Puccinia triticina]
MWLSVAIAISIALFNFCGLAVTKSISATARSLVGFIILVIGNFFFNQILTYPAWFKRLIGSAASEPLRLN